MPKDWNLEDEVVEAKYLQVGDCIRSRGWSEKEDEKNIIETGVIIASTFCDDLDSLELKRYYGQKDAVSQYDINCPSGGPFSYQVDANRKYHVIRIIRDAHVY